MLCAVFGCCPMCIGPEELKKAKQLKVSLLLICFERKKMPRSELPGLLGQTLLEQGIEGKKETSSISTEGIEVGKPVGLGNVFRVNKAEKAGLALTTTNSETGRRQVIARIPPGTQGKVSRRNETVYAQVGPIFAQIRTEAGARRVKEGENLVRRRQKVQRGQSLADQALIAQQEIESARIYRKAAEQDRSEHFQAQQAMADLQLTHSLREGNGKGKGLLRLLGDGLTDVAVAALSGEPRAGGETAVLDFNRGSMQVNAPTRRSGQTNVSVAKIVDGTFRPEVTLDPLSRAVNRVRGLLGKKPVAVLGVGVIRWRHTLSQEIVGGEVHKEPLDVFAQLNQGIEALRVLSRESLLIEGVPTFADLGLDGPELEAQSGTEPHEPQTKEQIRALLRKGEQK